MPFVRPVDWRRAQVALDKGYLGQYLYWGETCSIIATKVPPGAGGPPLHVHPVDQTYYVVEGEVDLLLGNERETIRAGSALFIPAGLAHHSWNGGDVDEIHVEVIAPGVLPTEAVATPCTSADGTSLRHLVRNGPSGDAVAGFEQHWLVDRGLGAANAALYLAALGPRASGPPLHVHEFDQFYFVLSGTLSVEIGLERHEVGPNQLVVLPAGVPHRQWNARGVPERHLTIIAPEPLEPHSADHPWDVAVRLGATGERID